MVNVTFRGPTGEVIQNPSEEYLRNLFVAPPNGYWKRGSGDAELEFYGTSGERLTLLVLPYEGLGYYLQWLKLEGRQVTETWLSLYDRAKLAQVVACGNEWMASVGLFLPPVMAGEAVSEFSRSGRRTERVAWIQPDEIPEDGNW